MPVYEQRMAKIVSNPEQNFISSFIKQISVSALMLFCISLLSHSQTAPKAKLEKRIIEIIHCDSLGQEGVINGDYKRLLGHVELKHNDILMFCDSAHHFGATRRVKAYGKVHISQGDTLNIYGDYLFYDGIEEKALMEGKVELVDKKAHLYTKAINYDIANKIASYTDSGKIINEKNTLTSLIGKYFTARKMFHFKDNVKIVNPEYVMTADTMEYNTETETAFFMGPTRVIGDSIYMYSEKGWYDTRNDVTRIWKNSYIDNKQQIIKGDSLFFNNKTGFGEAFRNISIADTTNDLLVTGNYGWYQKKPEKFMVTDKAVFIQVSGKDSLFLHADTISAIAVLNKSGLPYRLMRAYFGCKIYSAGLQAKCDSLSYSFQDSVIRLYRAPVLWSEVNQMKSDSIAIFTKNRKAEFMELYNSAFIVSLVDTIRFNQIKGRNMKAYFKDNKLFRIRIDGNGETIYFLVDKKGQIGWNRAKCARIEISIDDGKITEINEFENPDGILNPPLKDVIRQKLPGFVWLENIRPKSKGDIFKK
jgi:lipopolysaccharide export system protein LptA